MTIQQLRNTPIAALPALAQQIRERIIEVIATRGGHLGASLGVVELTMALSRFFDSIFDLAWTILRGSGGRFTLFTLFHHSIHRT